MGSFFENIFGKKREPLDLSIFNDPLCYETEWGALKRGGSNYRTHKLANDEEGNLVFKPSALSKFGFLIPVPFLFYMIYSGLFDVIPFSDNPVLMGMVLVFFAFGVISYLRLLKIRKFDFANGVYWKGFKAPKEVDDLGSSKNWAYLKDIGGLQIIRERVRSNRSNYASYELNLVLKNGDRRNVMDHGNLVRLREEAKQLSERLEVPLWDASDYKVS